MDFLSKENNYNDLFSLHGKPKSFYLRLYKLSKTNFTDCISALGFLSLLAVIHLKPLCSQIGVCSSF